MKMIIIGLIRLIVEGRIGSISPVKTSRRKIPTPRVHQSARPGQILLSRPPTDHWLTLSITNSLIHWLMLTLLTWFTLFTWRMMSNHFIHVCLVPIFQWERPAEGWNALWKVTVTRVSRSIFLFTVTSGCPGVFSNSLLHAGVQEYFLIHCRTQLSRSIF